jgi:16S rRNA (guanine527-N7)-methyltransferase
MTKMKQLEKFIRKSVDINASARQLEKFEVYMDLIIAWNEKINLTAINDPQEIMIKHFIDSILCFYVIPSHGYYSLIDIGTGAGFPGIPLKIMNPEMGLTLVESVRKKADFCKRVINSLQLEEVNIIQKRAEDVGQDYEHRENYDWAVARAVAPLPVLLEYMLPLVKLGGSAVAMKAAEIEEEIKNSRDTAKILGGKIAQPVFLSLPENSGHRSLVHIHKSTHTPRKYPRRPGMPNKKPLG